MFSFRKNIKQVYQERCHVHQHTAMIDPLGVEALRRACEYVTQHASPPLRPNIEHPDGEQSDSRPVQFASGTSFVCN